MLGLVSFGYILYRFYKCGQYGRWCQWVSAWYCFSQFTYFSLGDWYVYLGSFVDSDWCILLFNVISGRLFLGDAGAYGLGSILVLGGFYAVDANWVSIEFAAVMMSYPCVELVGSILRRAKARRSIFKPDNFHLHNIIHTRQREI